jgi:hypothetical protein
MTWQKIDSAFDAVIKFTDTLPLTRAQADALAQLLRILGSELDAENPNKPAETIPAS